MIKCPNTDCGFENVDGTQFCEACGEELPQSAASADTANQIACPECGEMNPADNLACEACGAELYPGVAPVAPVTPAEPETTPFDTLAAPAGAAAQVAAPPPPVTLTPGDLAPGRVKLVVEQGQTVGAQFVLGDEEMQVGREDEEDDIYPDIDLSDQDAGYVHRKHATLRFQNGNLTVEHLGGANKTRVNNKPIEDNTPQVVKLGDKIAFGKVVLRVLPA